jgi:serine/threonine protein kinase
MTRDFNSEVQTYLESKQVQDLEKAKKKQKAEM